MTFEITHSPGRKAIPLGPDVKGVKMVAAERYVWLLKLAGGTPIARSAIKFDDVAAVRADIAQFKTAAKGARFAKVVEI